MSPVDVRWLGALWCAGVLVEAPPGVEVALGRAGLLAATHTVVLPSGRTRGLAGLIGLLDAIAQTGRRHLGVLHHLGDERTPLLAQAWSTGWPERLTLELDGLGPGVTAEVPGVAVTFAELRMAEPAGDALVPLSGGGVRLETRTGLVAFAPAARPGAALERAIADADLAVIEVGVRPWPAGAAAFRPSVSEAITAGARAKALWLVGDDGERLGGDES
jgi:hypothetical protein